MSTLCDPMDCSLPVSSIHGIFQARVLEWLPFPSPLKLYPLFNYLLWSVLVISAEYVFTSKVGRLKCSFYANRFCGEFGQGPAGLAYGCLTGPGARLGGTEREWVQRGPLGRVDLMAGCRLRHLCVRLGFLTVQSR